MVYDHLSLIVFRNISTKIRLVIMTFTSLLFALFVGITLVIYYVLPAKKYQWAVLLAAGYFFYLYNRWHDAAYIRETTITI